MVTRLQQPIDAYDVPKIVSFFGGRNTLCDDLLRYEIVKLTPHAVDKWAKRGIPLARMEDLKVLAKKRRRKFELSSFIKKKAA